MEFYQENVFNMINADTLEEGDKVLVIDNYDSFLKKLTNDEMADKYVEEHGFESDHKNLTPQEVNEAIRQAYLAGLNDVKYPMA